MTIREQLDALAAQRILILDGAMGSMIQTFRLTEADFRGERFADHPVNLLGCNDILCLTQPDVIRSVHEAYLKAGADIIETCSFSATSVSLADFGVSELAYEVSVAAARLARTAADAFSTAEKPRFVAGSISPTTQSASLSPDMNDPAKRGVSFDELERAFYDNARGLLDGGADILLLETVYDTLNVKAAIFAIMRLFEERAVDTPIMLSATVSDAAGRLLSGQTVEAFCVSTLHARPWSIGLNCSVGSAALFPRVRDMAAFAPCLVSAYPNAGLPNGDGGYDETPETMAAALEAYMREGIVNIVGGCCGSTPAHIAAIAEKARLYAPRVRPAAGTPASHRSFLAGLEPLELDGAKRFVCVAEKTNVSGSKRFLQLIQRGDYHAALGIARDMLDEGADILNVCMDDALLDSPVVLERFLLLALADPDLARVPIMLDSSRLDVIERGLKLLQGKGVINSISLKEGEAVFLDRARLARRYGAAIVVMLFDEQGQAVSYERKTEIAARTYRLLVDDGFPPENIIFDSIVLSVATGIPEHDRYALDFIRAVAWIHEHCPYAHCSAGVPNLSFSFRGNDPVRAAMHTVFLKHARAAGIALAIVNPAERLAYEDIEPRLRDAVEDLILYRKADASERLLTLALESSGHADAAHNAAHKTASWRDADAEARMVQAVVRGIDEHIITDLNELRQKYPKPFDIVEGVLMRGMSEVGERFEQGTMFLPQVIRSARVMKQAVTVLEPFMAADKAQSTAAITILMATVKGDVHDIGKNIVGLVLSCNGYAILDLGTMVPTEKIIDTAIRERVSVIGLSGLISPSLDEMIRVARELEQRGLAIPLLIGGAAASLAHTALKIAPVYSAPVIYVNDASQSAAVVHNLLSADDRPRFLEELAARHREAVAHHAAIQARRTLIPLAAARENRVRLDWSRSMVAPKTRGIFTLHDYPVSRVIPYINWNMFLHAWDLGTQATESDAVKKAAGENLLADARRALDRVAREKVPELRAVVGLFPALSDGDDVLIYDPQNPERLLARFCFPRNCEQRIAGSPNPCLADFIMPKELASPPLPPRDWIGLFALSAGIGLTSSDDLILATLANALAEAFAEELHRRVRREWWAYAPDENLSVKETLAGTYAGIRPAFGYACCPSHEDKRLAFDLLQARERCGLELTESAMIIPAASVCGMYIAHPRSYYFAVGEAGID
ncbi:MAG: methionine synthase [Treponema sp.]|jgi:5-methyltetrahydrofolate--homocysteine methyltransferase|nr:methionine synthase [Treponema sp.]